MLKRKPVPKKPLLRPRTRAGGQPQPQPDAEDAENALVPDAALTPGAPPVPLMEDELALQHTPETKYSGEQLKRGRKFSAPAKGNSLEINDTSKLLVVAWAVIGVVVIVSIYFLLENTKSSTPDEPVDNGSSAAKAPPPKVDPAEQKLLNNPANKAALDAYQRFQGWALQEGSDWTGDKLTERMKQDVPIGAVDDPDLKSLYSLQLENFQLVPNHPMRPYQGDVVNNLEVTRKLDSTVPAAYEDNVRKMKGFFVTLKNRYSAK